ncbi:MAG TPA: segregation/condensation protein A [Candidatus Nanoarchaeia archaeon]|nr:segregation/condensation protein A [Candidatus Nanoarchaeia archaeon]
MTIFQDRILKNTTMAELLIQQKTATQDRIFSILFNQDEITWQNIIYELINTEQMDPWDIDVSLIAAHFLDTIKKLEATDFRLSGKIILASALLLKIKSNQLLDEDIAALDQMISGELDNVNLYDEIEGSRPRPDIPGLVPRTPQPRKRKVSVYDLIQALEKALEVEAKRKRFVSAAPMQVKMPDKKFDISEVIEDVYEKVFAHHQNNGQNALTFSQLVNSDVKEDKIFMFQPLLHLDTQGRIDLQQAEHFGEIHIHVKENKVS